MWAGRCCHCSGGETLAPSQVYCAGIVPLRSNAGLLMAIAPGIVGSSPLAFELALVDDVARDAKEVEEEEPDEEGLLAAGGCGGAFVLLAVFHHIPALAAGAPAPARFEAFLEVAQQQVGFGGRGLAGRHVLGDLRIEQFALDAHQQVGFGLADGGEVVRELGCLGILLGGVLVQSPAHFRFAHVDPEVGRFGEHPLRGDQEAEHLVLERRVRRRAVRRGVADRGGHRHPVLEGRLRDRRLLHRRHHRARRGLRHLRRAAGPARGGNHGGRRLRAAPAAGERGDPHQRGERRGRNSSTPHAPNAIRFARTSSRFHKSGHRVTSLRSEGQADQGRRERSVLCTRAIEDADMRRPSDLSRSRCCCRSCCRCSRSRCAASCPRTGCRQGRGRGPAAWPAPPAGCR